MELRQLQYFVSIVRHGHFGKAADELRLTQASLSQQLQQLERELRVQLLRRDRRTLELTIEGAAFLPHAKRILEEVDSAAREIRDLCNPDRGTVAIGVTTALVSLDVPELIAGFKTRHPEAQLSLVEESTSGILQAVRDGHLDVGLIPRLKHRSSDTGDLAIEHLFVEDVVAVVGDDSPLQDSSAVSLADLKDQQFLFPRRDSDTYSAIVGLFRESGFQPRVAVETADVAVALRLAEASLGVALVARSAAGMCQPSTRILNLCPPLSIDVQMVWSDSRYCSRTAESFIAFARRHFASRVDQPVV